MPFVAEPAESVEYLASMGMRWKDFVRASPELVSRLSHASGAGWALKNGNPYLTNSYAREWNGECLVDYHAYVPAGKAWKGDVYVGMYCQQ